MKNKNAYRIQQALALSIMMLGLGIGVDSLTSGTILQHVFAPNGMDLSAALLALLTGFTLMPGAPAAPRPGRKWLSTLCAVLLTGVPALLLLQQLSPQWLYGHAGATVLPERIEALRSALDLGACFGFTLAGISLLLFARGKAHKSIRWLRAALVYAVIAIGGVELLASLLRLDVMYQATAFSTMAAANAAVISLTGVALWLRAQTLPDADDAHADSPDQHLTRMAVLILAIVAVGTGLTSFVVLKQGFEQSMSDAFQRAAKNNAGAFASTLDQQLSMNMVIASRSALRNNLLRLREAPEDADALAAIEKAISIMPAGLSGVQILNTRGKLLASAGNTVRQSATSAIELKRANEKAILLWKDGFVLASESRILVNGQEVGHLITEQQLPQLNAMLREVTQEGSSTDTVICGRLEKDAICFPSRFYQANLRIPLFREDGQLAYAISHALLGQKGVLILKDLRGMTVLAGFSPIGDTGLGLVQKADTVEIYTPIRNRLHLLLLLLAGLVVSGTLILRSQILPLARQLVNKQQRMQGMLGGSQEAFVEIDQHGTITDWNTEAERTFGWRRSEVLGRRMADIIIPPALREAHERGMAAFLKDNKAAVLGKRIELPALHRSGREFPVEITISAMETEHGFSFIAFLHDISDRKAAEEKLISSEKRLHAITDNLPVLISYIDAQHCFQFANGTFEAWLGIAPEQVIGSHARAIFGAKIYEEQLPHLERALAGHRVEFEIDSVMQGGTRHLRNTFIPDMAADGRVIGIYTMSTDVTALVQSRRRIRTITDNMPARIAYIDAEQRFRFTNRLYQSVIGIDANNMIGRTMCEVFGDEAYSKIATQVETVLHGERVFFERHIEKRGSSKFLEYAYIPEIDADGKVLGFYSMVTDVTARKNAEIAREKDHELLEAILETVDVGVMACDEVGELSLFNRATREFHGLPETRIASSEWGQYYRLYYPDGRTLMATRDIPLYRALRGEQGNLDEMVIVSKAGVTRRIAASGRQLKGKKGENLGAVVVLSDITERRRIQDSLLASESRLRRLMNSSLIGIIQSDESGCLTEANDVFFQFSGYSRDTLLEGELFWQNMTSARYHTRQQQAINELNEQGTTPPFESELIRRDGSLAPIFIGIAHLEGSEREWVGFVLDLTEQRRLDRIKSEFISVVSHELRTPLTSIRGSLGLLQGGVVGQLPPKAGDLIKIAHKNSERLVGLVNDILDMEKLASGAISFDMRRLDLVALTAQSIEANAAYGQTYQVSYLFTEHPEQAWVLGDADRIMQALANLLSNAAKFSPRGERVLIRIRHLGTSIKLEVEDHGAGIPESFRDRIFGRFAQAQSNDTRQQGGAGLGLNITKTLIEKMGGEIGFHDDCPLGTVFWFTLPSAERTEEPGRSPREPLTALPL